MIVMCHKSAEMSNVYESAFKTIDEDSVFIYVLYLFRRIEFYLD